MGMKPTTGINGKTVTIRKTAKLLNFRKTLIPGKNVRIKLFAIYGSIGFCAKGAPTVVILITITFVSLDFYAKGALTDFCESIVRTVKTLRFVILGTRGTIATIASIPSIDTIVSPDSCATILTNRKMVTPARFAIILIIGTRATMVPMDSIMAMVTFRIPIVILATVAIVVTVAIG
jgi:hypothetical protein